MVLAFASKWLRAVCEDHTQAEAEFGTAVSELLRHRLADITAASSPLDLVAGSPNLHRDGDREFMTVSLSSGYRLEFVANHPMNPRNDDGDVESNKVSRVKIFGIAR